MSDSLNICWMAVEPQYAYEVQTHLQSLRARDGAVAAGGERGSSGRRGAAGTGAVWDDMDYDSFIATSQESYRRVRAFADELAGSPGEWISLTAACASAGITPTQVRAALGKFTTWMNAATSNEDWPFGWAYGEAVGSATATEFHYRMSEEQAAAWRAARQRAPRGA